MPLIRTRLGIIESQAYAKRFGQKFNPLRRAWDRLGARRKTAFIRFDVVPQLRIKLGSAQRWPTPQGVYAYPLSDPDVYKAAKKLIEHGQLSGLFAGRLPYVMLLEPAPGAKVVELRPGRDIPLAVKKKLLKAFVRARGVSRPIDDKAAAAPFDEIWRGFIAHLRRHIGGTKMRNALARLLQDAGIDVLIDFGTGTLSGDIETQAVFTSTAAVNVIAVGDNPMRLTRPKPSIPFGKMSKLFIEAATRLAQRAGLTLDDFGVSGAANHYIEFDRPGEGDRGIEVGLIREVKKNISHRGMGDYKLRGRGPREHIISDKPRGEAVVIREIEKALRALLKPILEPEMAPA